MTNPGETVRRSSPYAKGAARFRHILVPTDLTARTEKAVELAFRLAAPDTSRVTLLHVIETIDGLPFDDLRPFYERLERKAQKTMGTLARQVLAPASRQVHTVAYGRRAEQIVKFASANGVDLIVLASHRVNPSRINRDWGTISYKVGILAQCPVLLVK